MPGIWNVRYSVTENTLTPGRISDEELRRALAEDGRGWVAEENGQVVGFAIGLRTGRLWALFVHPEAQGRGLGSRLHDELLHWFLSLPVRVLWLSTAWNSRARKFYEDRGWRFVAPYGSEEVRMEYPAKPARRTPDIHSGPAAKGQ